MTNEVIRQSYDGKSWVCVLVGRDIPHRPYLHRRQILCYYFVSNANFKF